MTQDARHELLTGLSSTDSESATHKLDSVRIVVQAADAHVSLGLSIVNLLARLVPNVALETRATEDVDLPVFGCGGPPALAANIVESVCPRAALEPTKTVRLAVGETAVGANLYVSSSAWSLRLGRTPHQPLTGTGPATVAASALAAAETIRAVVPDLPGRRLDDETFTWNLLDYQCTLAPNELPLAPVAAVCFGGGSVGSSVIYSLLLGGGSGEVVVVDPDKLTARNRIRYPALVHPRSSPKADWLQDLCAHTPLHVTGQTMTAREFIRTAGPIELAISAVDTAQARREVADALAKQALNVGVAADQFHVSRHGFADGLACVYCGYVDLGEPKNEADVYADITGLSVDRASKLLAGESLSCDDVDQLVAAGSIATHERAEFEGARLVDVARQRLYAEVVPTGHAQTPMAAPYVSALAGAIVAAEMQKGLQASPYWLDRRIDIDCSGLPTGFQSRPLQDRSGRCLCASQFRVNAYRSMWLPR
jgi:hypothetical protein